MKISFSRYNFFGWLGGLGLLILPIFFNENFNAGWFSVIFYMLLVASGVTISLYFFAKIIDVKPIYIFAITILCEISIFCSIQAIKNQKISSPYLVKNCQNFYTGHLRNIPSYQRGLGKYDSELFYTLKPSNQSFTTNSNIEFSNLYKVNSIGVRDDEASLDFPEIIMLGDSHTMGWGVDQHETFSSLLEKKARKKVLNTGIASYGSAREYLMFKRLKKDSCKTIIWQYCSNDMPENQSFLENKNGLEISSEEEYEFGCKRNFIQANYYPFKYCFEILGHQFRKARYRSQSQNQPQLEITTQVSNFFSIIELLQEDFKGEIIIFNLESFETTDKYYLAFKKYIEKHHLEKIQLIDFSKILDEDDYFIIDDHINVSGHQKVSEAIFRKIQKESKSMSQNGI